MAAPEVSVDECGQVEAWPPPEEPSRPHQSGGGNEDDHDDDRDHPEAQRPVLWIRAGGCVVVGLAPVVTVLRPFVGVVVVPLGVVVEGGGAACTRKVAGAEALDEGAGDSWV